MNNHKTSILVIDDDPVMRLSCQKILTREGFRIETFEDGQKGLEKVHQEKPDLIIVDLKMPKVGGMEVISGVRELDPDIIIVVITGYATIGTAVDAMKAGAYDFLPKPFTADELRLIVRRGLERRHLVEESKRLREEKEKLQRHFITFVSHQLQSPLVAIQQYLDVLKHLGDTPRKKELQEEWIDRCLVRTKELLALIRDWLTISKIDGGVLVDRIRAVTLAPLLSEILKTYEEQAKQNGITIALKVPETLAEVSGDEESLTILFDNLIVNAIKYNKPQGSITVTAAEETDEVLISVTDTGIGIPRESIEFIFEEFGRVRNASTKHISGTGLGLPICRKIVGELNGSIEVRSRMDEGSTFLVRLPKHGGE